MSDENTPLIRRNLVNSGLNLLFATFCIIDIFGVFPIIALPRAIVQCGLLGIPLVLVMLILQIYTAILLGKSWTIISSIDPQISKKNRYPLAAVTEITLGSKFRTIVTILLDLTIFSAGIPNLLVASHNLQLFGLKISQNDFNLSFCYWLLAVGILLCPLMWFGSPRDMKWLSTFSTSAVCFTALLAWWCIITDDRELNVLPVPTSISLDKFIAGYGMLAFQFDIHPTLMTVQVDMRNPENIHRAIVLSFLATGVLFGTTTALSVWKYGGSTTANVLQAVPPGYVICAVILIAAIQLCFSCSLGNSPLFLHLEEILRVEPSFGWKRIATRSAVVCLAVAIGESVPRFDVVMSLIGSTLTGPLIFIFPPLIYSQAKALKEKVDALSRKPEIVSGTKRYSYNNTPSDTRIHSRSLHVGFSDTEDGQQNYSYIYYDREVHADEYTDSENDLFDGQSNRANHENETDGRLIILEPAELRRTGQCIDYQQHNYHKCLSWEMLIECFGYFIVIFGIVITVSSTYINVSNTIKFVKFTPPCIVNSSIFINLL